MHESIIKTISKMLLICLCILYFELFLVINFIFFGVYIFDAPTKSLMF